MPHLRGVTVHVTNSHGESLQEWGVQYLRQSTGESKVSAYVQSTTDVAFQISLRPDIPFLDHVLESDSSRGGNRSRRKKTTSLAASSEDRSVEQSHDKMSNDALLPLLPSSTASRSPPTPNFAFLAVLYLDGRTIPERKIILYVDPTDKDFSSPDGKVAFKHRWVQSADGGMTEHAWVFKEKAIETVFDKMMVTGTETSVGVHDDDDALIKAMESSELDPQRKTETRSKIGQIVVELQRVVLGEKRTEANFRPRHQKGQEEDIDMEGAPQDITHATGLSHKKTLKARPLRVVDYWPYHPKEGPYATFQFFYRSRAQLQRFHFPGFVSLSTTKTARTTRALNTRMADLTPLSISLPLDKKTKNLLCDQNSYEGRIETRGFKLDGGPKYDFGSRYRDIRATSPSAVDEACEAKGSPNHPAAASPSTTNKLVENYSSGTVPPKTGQTPAVAPLLAGNPLASDLGNKLQARRHVSRPKDLDAPTLTTSKSYLSVPSSSESTEEQVANITNKDCYRDSAGGSYPSDQEDDIDMESDLETNAGDDEFSHTVDPEDEGYDSLHSKVNNVSVRKRHRDDVEDAAEDDNEAGKEGDTAHLDGGRKRKTLKLRSTEGNCAHVSRKLRIAEQNLVADGGRDSRVTGGVASNMYHERSGNGYLGE